MTCCAISHPSKRVARTALGSSAVGCRLSSGIGGLAYHEPPSATSPPCGHTHTADSPMAIGSFPGSTAIGVGVVGWTVCRGSGGSCAPSRISFISHCRKAPAARSRSATVGVGLAAAAAAPPASFVRCSTPGDPPRDPPPDPHMTCWNLRRIVQSGSALIPSPAASGSNLLPRSKSSTYGCGGDGNLGTIIPPPPPPPPAADPSPPSPPTTSTASANFLHPSGWSRAAPPASPNR